MIVEAKDYVYYKGKRYAIEEQRGTDVLFDPEDFGLNVESSEEPQYRGYIANYGVTRDGRLVLKDLRVRLLDVIDEPLVEPEMAPAIGDKRPCLDACGVWVYRDVNILLYYWGELVARRSRPFTPFDVDGNGQEEASEKIHLAFYCGKLGYDKDYVNRIEASRSYPQLRYESKTHSYEDEEIPF